MNILKKINLMRIERGWSIYRLSIESGVSQSTLTNMFNRETLPSIPTLESICNAFKITLSDFFKEENNTYIYEDDEILSLFHKLNGSSKESILTIMKELINK